MEDHINILLADGQRLSVEGKQEDAYKNYLKCLGSIVILLGKTEDSFNSGQKEGIQSDLNSLKLRMSVMGRKCLDEMEKILKGPSNMERSRSELSPISTISQKMRPFDTIEKKYTPSIPHSPYIQRYVDIHKHWKLQNSDQVDDPQVKQEPLSDPQLKHQLFQLLSLIQLSAQELNITHLKPWIVARQLYCMQNDLFMNIDPKDILIHSPPSSIVPSFQALTDFFNYLTRMVETSILSGPTSQARANIIKAWIHVAEKSYEYADFQTLKALVSAFGTPPISRLSKTWALLSKKSSATFQSLSSYVSESNNFQNLRGLIHIGGHFPSIPYMGILVHDVTYLKAVVKKDDIPLTDDSRIQAILDLIKYYQGSKVVSNEESDDHVSLSTSKSSVYSEESLTLHNHLAPPATRGYRFGFKKSVEGELKLLSRLEDKEQYALVTHWILSRKWVSEKVVDEMSQTREPRCSMTNSEHQNTIMVSAPIPPTLKHQRSFGTGGKIGDFTTVPDFSAAFEFLDSKGLELITFVFNSVKSSTLNNNSSPNILADTNNTENSSMTFGNFKNSITPVAVLSTMIVSSSTAEAPKSNPNPYFQTNSDTPSVNSKPKSPSKLAYFTRRTSAMSSPYAPYFENITCNRSNGSIDGDDDSSDTGSLRSFHSLDITSSSGFHQHHHGKSSTAPALLIIKDADDASGSRGSFSNIATAGIDKMKSKIKSLSPIGFDFKLKKSNSLRDDIGKFNDGNSKDINCSPSRLSSQVYDQQNNSDTVGKGAR